MREIIIKIGPMVDRDCLQKSVLYLLEGLVNINREYLRRNKVPLLYDSGVKYSREDETEEWQSIPVILDRRCGDCEDLASWRVAELRESGIKCRPFLKWKNRGNFYLYHVLVVFTGEDKMRFEDPSKILGMGRAE